MMGCWCQILDTAVGVNACPRRTTLKRIAVLVLLVLFFKATNFTVTRVDSGEILSILKSPISQSRESTVEKSCLATKGSSGAWVKDLSYAAKAQYLSHLQEGAGSAIRAFRPTDDVPYFPPSTYRWRDNDNEQKSNWSCQMELCTLEGMCHALAQLHITRLFFVGDSLTYMQVQSLWKLFGLLDDPGEQFGPGFDRALTCPSSTTSATTNFTFSVVYVRNDHLSKEGSCKDICNPWIDKYFSSRKRTLFVGNIGAHIMQFSQFRSEFDAFVELMNHTIPANDMIFFRTTVPGHGKCNAFHAPFNNMTEFFENQQYDKYGWDKFTSYNDHVKQRIYNLQQLEQNNFTSGRSSSGRKWFVLDVFPMTVLRPDGHRGGHDCLHYSLPGPPDWWNHLLYSTLLDVVT